MTAKTDLLVPEYINGRPTFVPYSRDIQRQIKEGSPTFNWAGDERLYVTPRDGAEGFAIGRLNEDDTKSLVCVSEAPHKLDEGILIWLAEHDTRHVDVLGRIEANNARIKKEADTQMKERVAEAYDRVVHGLVKDTGGIY